MPSKRPRTTSPYPPSSLKRTLRYTTVHQAIASKPISFLTSSSDDSLYLNPVVLGTSVFERDGLEITPHRINFRLSICITPRSVTPSIDLALVARFVVVQFSNLLLMSFLLLHLSFILPIHLVLHLLLAPLLV